MSLSNIRNVDHTILLCSKLEETKAFYRDVMGFPIELDRPGWVTFRVGGCLLALRPRTPGEPYVDGDGTIGSASVQLAFRVPVSAVDACHAELVGKGVPIVRGPLDLAAARHRAVFFRDPENNLVEIYAEL